MPHLSQNKKIAISALAIFMISFAFMLFFLDQKVMDENTQGANVFGAGGHGAEAGTVVEVKAGKVAPEKEKEPTSTEKSRKWMETIYPKIKELEDGDSGRLMVDKIF